MIGHLVRACRRSATVLALLLAAAGQSAAQPATPPAPAASAADCLRGAGADASLCGSPALQLVYTEAVLPAARLGERYAPTRYALGGRPDYRAEVIRGTAPPGLVFGRDGMLGGTPDPRRAQARSYAFTLELRDGADPPQVVRQAYAIRVLPAPRTAAPAASKPAAKPPPTVADADADRALEAFAPGRITYYRLQSRHLEAMVKAAAAAASAAAGAAPAPEGDGLIELPFSLEQLQAALQALGLPVGDADAGARGKEPSTAARSRQAPPPPRAERRATHPAQLKELLTPLLDIEYPTLTLFEGALRARQCDYWHRLLVAAAARQGRPAPAADCAAVLAEAPRPSPPEGWTLRALLESVLPEETRMQAIRLARTDRWLDKAGALQWNEADCGCVLTSKDDLVYAFYPFWQMDNAERKLDFSLVNRIGFLGIQFDDGGSAVMPHDWQAALSDFARKAQRHGTKLDLVLHRNDWTLLLARPPAELDVIARRVATMLRAQIDRDHGRTLADRLNHLVPWWRHEAHVFEGVTLFFEDSPPPQDAARHAAFRRFLRTFVDALIVELQRTARPLALNIVVPDQAVGAPGAYAFEELIRYIETAERPDNPMVPEGAERWRYKGSTDLTVRYLVLLREPTTDRKKDLRDRLDRNESVKGHRRIALFGSLVPVVFLPSPDAETRMGEAEIEQLDMDLAYYKWVYGGVGVWPLPVAHAGAGSTVIEQLRKNYPALREGGLSQPVCHVVCPRRDLFRTLWLGLTLAGALSLGLYLWVCRVHQLGRLYLLLVGALLASATLIGLALLRCDPALRLVQERDWVQNGAIALVALLIAWFGFRPSVPRP